MCRDTIVVDCGSDVKYFVRNVQSFQMSQNVAQNGRIYSSNIPLAPSRLVFWILLCWWQMYCKRRTQPIL